MYRKVKKKIAASASNLESPAIKRKSLEFSAPETKGIPLEAFIKPNSEDVRFNTLNKPKSAFVKVKFPDVQFYKNLDAFFFKRAKTNIIFFDFRRTKSHNIDLPADNKASISYSAEIITTGADIYLYNEDNQSSSEPVKLTVSQQSYNFSYDPVNINYFDFLIVQPDLSSFNLEYDAAVNTSKIEISFDIADPLFINFQPKPAASIDIEFKNKHTQSFNVEIDEFENEIDSISYHLEPPEIIDHISKLVPNIYDISLLDAELNSDSISITDELELHNDFDFTIPGIIDFLKLDAETTVSDVAVIDILGEYFNEWKHQIVIHDLMEKYRKEVLSMPLVIDKSEMIDEPLPEQPEITDVFEIYKHEINTLPGKAEISFSWSGENIEPPRITDIMAMYYDEITKMPEPVDVLKSWSDQFYSMPEIINILEIQKDESQFIIPKLYKVKIKSLENLQSTVTQSSFTSISSTLLSKEYFNQFQVQDLIRIKFKPLRTKLLAGGLKLLLKNKDTASYKNIYNEYSKFVAIPSIEITDKEKKQLYQGLFKFQEEGADFLSQNRFAVLGDELGLGKTIETIGALKLLIKKYEISRVLIICPKEEIGDKELSTDLQSTIGWEGQLNKWAPNISVTSVNGNSAKGKNAWDVPAQIYITSYSDIINDIKNNILPAEKLKLFDCIIFDEFNFLFYDEKASSGILNSFEAKYIWFLSSTKTEQLKDKINKISSLIPDVELNSEQILERTKAEVSYQLPSIIRREIWVEFDERQKKEYAHALLKGRKQLADFLTTGNIMRFQANVFFLLHQLKQISNFYTGSDTSSKSELLIRQIKQIASFGGQVLVYSHYDKLGTKPLEKLFKANNIRYINYLSGMTADDLEKASKTFTKDKTITVLLTSLKSSGGRSNLPKVPYIIHFDQVWNPSSQWQIEDIISSHIKGKEDENLNVYSYMSAGSIDSLVIKTLNSKGLLNKNITQSIAAHEFNNLISDDEWIEMLGIISKTEESEQKNEIEKAVSIKKLRELTDIEIVPKLTKLFLKFGYKLSETEESKKDSNIDLSGTFKRNNNEYNVKAKLIISPNTKSIAIKEYAHFTSLKPDTAKVFVVLLTQIEDNLDELNNETITIINERDLASYMSLFRLI